MGEKLEWLDEKQENGSLKSLASFIPPAPFIKDYYKAITDDLKSIKDDWNL